MGELRYKILKVKVRVLQMLLFALNIIVRPVIILLSRTYIGRQIVFLAQMPASLLVADAEGSVKFLVNSSDLVIGRRTYVSRHAFEAEKLFMVFRIIESDVYGFGSRVETLFDIGANIGTIGITAVARNIVDRCIAFEPEPNNFRLLDSNIRLNGLGGRISAFNVALSDGSLSELEFELNKMNFGDHRVRVSESPGLYQESSRCTIKVPARRLDEFCDDVRLHRSVIWMDVQGHEGYVLAGSDALIERGVPIMTEFSPYLLHRARCFGKFVSAVERGRYKNLIILSGVDLIRKPCNANELVSLASKLDHFGAFVDILIY